MQTRKNRKNDETSYEKMLKLRFGIQLISHFTIKFTRQSFRRDLNRAVKLLEMVKRREKTKREELQLSIEIYEKRYQAKDFSGQLLAEYTSAATKLRFVKATVSEEFNAKYISTFAFQTGVCTFILKSVSSPAFVESCIISAQSMELVFTKLFKSTHKSSPAEQQARL